MTNGPRRFSKYRDGVSLQEHLEKMINLRFDAVDKGIVEARRVMEARMDGFPNEFVRKGDADVKINSIENDVKTLKDLITQFVTRPEAELTHTNMENDIKSLMEVKNQMVGKASNNFVIVSIVISLVVLGLTMLRHFRV
jgi:hypothetical protein